MAQQETFRPTSLNLPMVIVGTLLGSLVCAANMYFGLQVGSINTMATSTALLSFAIFKSSARWLHYAFTPTENVVVQTIASSMASMPLAASLLSVIPAFEYLRKQDEGGVRHFSFPDLSTWALGVSLFGTVFGAPFRNYFLLRQRLRFPGGYATGVLIGMLHKDGEVARMVDADKSDMSDSDQVYTNHSDNEEDGNSSSSDQSRPDKDFVSTKVVIVFKAFGATTLYVRSSCCVL